MLSWACLAFHGAPKWREIAEARPEREPLISEFLGIRLSGKNINELDTKEIVEHVEFWRSAIGSTELARALYLKARAGELSEAENRWI